MKPIVIYGSFLLFFCFALSCGKEARTLPENHEQLVALYIELARLQSTSSPQNPVTIDSARNVIRRYGFTEEKVRDTIAYLNEDPVRWKAFYSEVQKRLNENLSTSPPSSQR